MLNGSSYSLENVQVLARRRSGSPTRTVPRMWVTDGAVFPSDGLQGRLFPGALLTPTWRTPPRLTNRLAPRRLVPSPSFCELRRAGGAGPRAPPPWGVPARCGRRPAGARPVSGTPCACCEQRAVAPSPPPPPQPKLVSGGCIVLLSCTEQTRACGWPQRSELGGDARTQPRQRGPGSEGRARGGWRSPLARSFSVLMSGLRLRAPVLWAPLGTRIAALTWGPLEAHKVTLSAQPRRWGGPALEAWPLSLSAACALARGH